MESQGIQNVIDTYKRWRSFDYSHAECLQALRNRDARLNAMATSEEFDRAIALLEAHGDNAVQTL
jgi:hypothetical protein